jgi:hypothetical protein
LGRGRRTREETPPVPDRDQLADVDRRAQRAIAALVEQAGGRWGIKTTPIPIGDVDVLTDLFEAWGRRHARHEHGRDYFAGQPGFWHALDELYPLQDPNRWDKLRLAVTNNLIGRGWERRGAANGATWWLPI